MGRVIATIPVSPRRGDVWFGDLDPIVGHEQESLRPLLVISDDRFNAGSSRRCVIVPITRTDKNLRIHVRVAPPEGSLREPSVILCDHPRSISHDRLDHRQGRVSPQTMAAVEDRLRRLLDL